MSRLPLKRAIRRAAAVAGALALTAASALSWHVLAPPPAEPLPLAAGLVSATSAESRRLLAESAHKTDHAQLGAVLVPQRRRAYCGPATGAGVVNAALRPSTPVTQSSFFDTAGPHAKGALAASLSGLTLDELAALLRAHGLAVRTVYADAADAAAFRADAQAALVEPLTFIVVNYDRRLLQQAGAGHISPLGAYHAATDRLLVMDVAAHRYPHTWVPLDRLWAAMDTVDGDAGRRRGYLLVSAAGRGAGADGR